MWLLGCSAVIVVNFVVYCLFVMSGNVDSLDVRVVVVMFVWAFIVLECFVVFFSWEFGDVMCLVCSHGTLTCQDFHLYLLI